MLGEKWVLREFPKAIIIRPSIIFGAEDKFINFFAKIINYSYLTPLIGGGSTKLQPIYVGDVATIINYCLKSNRSDLLGKVLEIGGPEVLTLKKIIQIILKTRKSKRVLLKVPYSLAKLLILPLQLLPNPQFTANQIELLKYDNIVKKENFINKVLKNPSILESKIKQYL